MLPTIFSTPFLALGAVPGVSDWGQSVVSNVTEGYANAFKQMTDGAKEPAMSLMDSMQDHLSDATKTAYAARIVSGPAASLVAMVAGSTMAQESQEEGGLANVMSNLTPPATDMPKTIAMAYGMGFHPLEFTAMQAGQPVVDFIGSKLGELGIGSEQDTATAKGQVIADLADFHGVGIDEYQKQIDARCDEQVKNVSMQSKDLQEYLLGGSGQKDLPIQGAPWHVGDLPTEGKPWQVGDLPMGDKPWHVGDFPIQGKPLHVGDFPMDDKPWYMGIDTSQAPSNMKSQSVLDTQEDEAKQSVANISAAQLMDDQDSKQSAVEGLSKDTKADGLGKAVKMDKTATKQDASFEMGW